MALNFESLEGGYLCLNTLPIKRKFKMANGHGGKRDGAGRNPDWLRAKCDEIIEKYDLMAFLGKVAGGENVEQVVTDQGETLPVPASVKDRLRAAEMLLDRRYGKPTQSLEHSGEINGSSRLVFVFDNGNSDSNKS